MCKCGHNDPISLSRIAQACELVSETTKRHNNIDLHVTPILEKRGFDVIMETRFQTVVGVRKPDL